MVEPSPPPYRSPATGSRLVGHNVRQQTPHRVALPQDEELESVPIRLECNNLQVTQGHVVERSVVCE